MGLTFEQWYEGEYRRILAACVAVAGDYGLAKDATDEAFVRALRAWDRVALMSAPGGWTQTVALNLVKRAQRRRRLERVFASGAAVTACTEVAFRDVDLWAEVRNLPPRQRTAVILRYLHDLSEREVASAMGISRGAASAALSMARAKLRNHLSLEELEEASDE